MAYRTLLRRHECVLLELQSLFVAVWNASPTIEGVRQMGQLLLIESLKPQGLRILTVVNHSLGVPQSDVRRAVTKAIQATDPYTRMASTAILGHGFAVSAVRSFLTGMFLAVGPKYPMKFTSSVEVSMEFIKRNWDLDIPLASRQDVQLAVNQFLPTATEFA